MATTDLRGHGDSDVTFASYGDVDTAEDVTALIEELGNLAVVVGNSMGAGSAVLGAAKRPELVSGLVLIGPFVRNGNTNAIQRMMIREAMAPLWAASAWKSYMPKLYAGECPTDFEAYRAEVVASLRRPGYAKAFSLTTHTNHHAAGECLREVKAPTLVVMGEKDPDFPDPGAEAEWVAGTLHGAALMVSDAGHYPQSQRPDITTDAVLQFLKTLDDR